MSKKEVKTRFPVARIKRLMQSDDEIGKVAQATPVVVAKSLELFMISLIESTCNEAKARNSKRVSPSHLKEAVMHTEQFDFLQDLMSKYPDAIAPVAEGQETTKKTRAKKTAEPVASPLAKIEPKDEFSSAEGQPIVAVKAEHDQNFAILDVPAYNTANVKVEEEETEYKPRKKVIRPEDL